MWRAAFRDDVELRDRVLQVVHHEGGQPVVGLELAALRQLAIGVVLRDVRRDVPAHRLEQIAILVRQSRTAAAASTGDEADHAIELHERRKDAFWIVEESNVQGYSKMN